MDEKKEEIRKKCEELLDAFNEHDVNRIMSIYKNCDDLYYLENDHFTRGWNPLKEGFVEWHKSNGSLSASIIDTHIKFIKADVATVVCELFIYLNDQKIQKMYVTIVFVHEDGNWVGVTMHESFGKI